MKKLILLLFASLFTSFGFSQCSDLIISEYVEGWSNNKAIEIYNTTSSAIDLNGYALVRFRNQSTTPGNLLQLEGVLQAYDVYVVVLDKRDSNGTGFEAPVWDELQLKADTFANPVYGSGEEAMYFNGDDAVAILSGNGTEMVDLFGVIGDLANPDGWGFYGTDTAGNSLYLSQDHTLQRRWSVQSGITVSPSSFDPAVEWDSLPANTFTELGAHISTCDPTDIKKVSKEQKSKFWLFPSPSESGYIQIRTNYDIDNIDIINIMGQKIMSESYNTVKTNKLSLKLENVGPGAYFVSVTFENGEKITRQVILK